MAVFGSPRSAIRAAVTLQQRFVEETIADPSLPLTVGIGLDAGEAVAVEGGPGRLVPDLALSIPSSTDGGRSYIFEVRQASRTRTVRSSRPRTSAEPSNVVSVST